MSRLSCDVLIVGTELCGLAAGALIAQQHGGRRVVVVEDGDPTLGLPLGDRVAPAAPSLLRLPTHGAPALVLEALGLRQDARRALGAEPGGLGIVDDPEIRMIVPVDAEARARELARVFPADEGARAATRLHEVTAEGVAPLIDEAALVHEDGFFEKRRAKKRLAALGGAAQFDHLADASTIAELSIGVALAQLVPFVQYRPDANARGLGGHLAALQLQAGAHAGAKGGLGPRAALCEMLLDIIRRHRGEVLKERLETVQADGKHLTSVHITGANDYAPRVVIDATSRRDLITRLPEGRRRDKLAESEARVVHGADAAAARWLVPIGVLPRGMPPVFLTLRPPPDHGVLIGIFAGASLKQGHKSTGIDDTSVAVVAATLCESGAGERAAQEVSFLLDRLMPFARDLARTRDLVFGAPARAALPSWSVVESEHLLGGRRPMTPYANLLRAGRDLVPGLGIDGELAAARAVATAAEAPLGRRTSEAA
ncbi:MAG: hypothetical protein IT383_08145 [Deltaproteobacteria bacterium]|nr:hypothetical protein [Deltaproteobacteria bacterium]